METALWGFGLPECRETPFCFWTVKLGTAEVLNTSPFVVLKLRIAMCKGL